ncbi:MAG: hypothetical protein HYT79_10895 [Elusimicrobia bacterium]|nr:hypothetical protein [Elusimicrobiota bacterium]
MKKFWLIPFVSVAVGLWAQDASLNDDADRQAAEAGAIFDEGQDAAGQDAVEGAGVVEPDMITGAGTVEREESAKSAIPEEKPKRSGCRTNCFSEGDSGGYFGDRKLSGSILGIGAATFAGFMLGGFLGGWRGEFWRIEGAVWGYWFIARAP